MIKTIIIGDDHADYRILKRIRAIDDPDILIVAKAKDVKTALCCIEKHNPSLLIMLANLSDGNCFDVLNGATKQNFKTILIGKCHDYAPGAFEYDVCGFLVLPFDNDQLKKAVARAKKQIMLQLLLNYYRTVMDGNAATKKRLDFITIPTIKGFTVIWVDQIIKCEGKKHTTTFYITGNKKVESIKTLCFYDFLLDEPFFMKVGKPVFVNLRKMEDYNHITDTITLAENLTAQLGATYKPAFLHYFNITL